MVEYAFAVLFFIGLLVQLVGRIVDGRTLTATVIMGWAFAGLLAHGVFQ